MAGRRKKAPEQNETPTAFRYVGDHENMAAFGIVFRVDGEDLNPEVSDPFILGKLRGNNHFQEV